MTARREIGKWLNEQPNREIDRQALAELCVEYDTMQENEFDTALLESELDDVKRAATRLADALQDVYNTIGEMPEVNRIFSSVAEDVAEHKGMVHNGGQDEQ